MSKLAKAYIGDKNSGKTTILYNIYKERIINGKRILIIDSATEHADKSLLLKVYNENCVDIIPCCKQEDITFPQVDSNTYPNNIIKNYRENVYLCDSSYYLERGYDFPEGILRENQRNLYKYFSMQVVSVLLDKIDVILMDEIELLSEFKNLIYCISSRNIELIMTLHEDEGLAGMHSLFHIERLIKS